MSSEKEKKIQKKIYVYMDIDEKSKKLSEEFRVTESEIYEAALNFLVECKRSQQAAIMGFLHLCRARRLDPEAAAQFEESVRQILGAAEPKQNQ
jgi:hypothetical protein